MGLTLKAVNKDYRYNEQGEGIGDSYLSTDCGYGSFWRFRNDLIKFTTKGQLSSATSTFEGHELCWCWYDDKTYKVAMLDTTSENVKNDKEYIGKLKKIKKLYPKLYDIYSFIAHCDCTR